ncbi:phosphate ABC transporter ATP-binding protein (PhoT family) [Litoreibacter ponti]|uniref:Phosphate ABC transporter ATP-binding protein (PhoT family) n=1 Tax=Litoreibacter ponti TaxID=1510457 RepID=A0A2T6BEV2_9RHOB|nr:phosphate ABC transporter ATP-binding protein (PhoT family) [Litoreibacter ponti]
MSILPLSVTGAVVRRKGETLVGPVDLEVAKGAFVIVIGPNGSGKTTLIRSLHGLQRLTEGRMQYAVPTAEADQKQAYVSQQPIMMRRTVLDNLAYPLVLQGMGRTAARAKAAEAAVKVGLRAGLSVPAPQLSGGEKQKLALARAMMRAPELLFLDEPCANLDGRATAEIEALLLAEHARGTTLMMATHNMGQARRLASDVVFMLGGRIHERAAATDFFDGPATDEARAFLKGDIV